MNQASPSPRAASHGEPSYIWREGQKRRLNMILEAAGDRIHGSFLEVGCGIGLYLKHIHPLTAFAVGLEYEGGRARQAVSSGADILQGAGERLPFPGSVFDLVLSHEVIEHVKDDRAAVKEMIRALKPGGRLVLFCPNRWYPFETHGIYWRGEYIFGNIPFVNYLPDLWRDRLAPHVRAYSRGDLLRLFAGLPVRFIRRTVIFGGYDNIIRKAPRLGRLIRAVLHKAERTPFRVVGLSHLWVVEKTSHG